MRMAEPRSQRSDSSWQTQIHWLQSIVTVNELQEKLELSLGIFRDLHLSEADGCGDLWVVWHSPVWRQGEQVNQSRSSQGFPAYYWLFYVNTPLGLARNQERS